MDKFDSELTSEAWEVAQEEIDRLRAELDAANANHRSMATQLANIGRDLERARKALEFIAEGYDNHDVNHVDYRVKVFQVATEALAEIAQKGEP